MNELSTADVFGGSPAPQTFSTADLFKPADPFTKEALDKENAQSFRKDLWGDAFSPETWTAPRVKKALTDTGKEVVQNTAALGDLLLGVPGQVASVIVDLHERARQLAGGASKKDTLKAVGEERTRALDTYAKPILAPLASKMTGSEDPSKVEEAMHGLTDLIDKAGTKLAGQGYIEKENFNSLVNEAMALGGLAGFRGSARAHVTRMEKAHAKEVNGEAAPMDRTGYPDEFGPPKEPEVNPDLKALTARAETRLREQAAQREARLATDDPAPKAARAARRADVRAAIAEDPLWADYLANRGEAAALAREAGRAEQARLTPEEMAPRTRSPARTSVDEAARTIEGVPGLPPDQLRLADPSPLDSGLAKTAQGRSFDLTAPELAAINASKSAWNRPGIYVPKGQRGAVNVEALIPKKGEGLTFEELAQAGKMALGSLLQRSEYTLKTLDRLPQNKTEFTKSHIQQELKRQDVTQAERDVLQSVLDRTEGDTISSNDLMRGFKEITGNYELTPKETGDFAGYGLDRINRIDGDGGNGTRVPGSVEATTTLYRAPDSLTLSKGNHFQDPQYFGHTRSFVEGGVRHVTELQSDLAQKAKGAVKTEELPALREQLERVVAEIEQRFEAGEPRSELQPLLIKRAELRAKYDATKINGQVAPMIKNWPKRLVREELGRAAENGEASVRFATGDTVAKVEGWPDPRAEFEARLAVNRRALAAAERVGNSVAASSIKRILTDLEEGLKELPEGSSLTDEHASIKARYDGGIAKFLKQLGGEQVTDAQGHTWIEVPTGGRRGPKQMFGGTDPDLMRAAALAGVGATAAAAFANDKKLGAAALGALAGLGLHYGGGKIASAADYGLGVVSTRIKNISEPLMKRTRDYERLLLQNTHDRIAKVDPFLVSANKLKGKAAADLNLALTSNDAAAIRKAVEGNSKLSSEWNAVKTTLAETGQALKAHGIVDTLRQDYFPRIVKDREGLLEKLGTRAKGVLEQRLKDAELKSVKATGEGLSDVEQSTIINQYLRGLRSGDYAPGFAKGRVIDEVTTELMPFYAPPAEALHTYLSSATRAIEKARLFGRDAVKGGDGKLNTQASIGELVRRELAEGKINDKQATELESIFQSRFGPGERGANPLLQHVKNLTNAGLLGNVVSAASQLGDTFIAAYAHGMRPTLDAVTRKLVGKQQVSAKDFGLVDHISEEFVSTSRSAKFLNAAFKWNGFTAVDLFGKDVNLNAALSKWERAVKTAAGEKRLAAKYKEAFGGDYAQLVEDLKAKKVTDNVRSLLFNELSDFQPISKLEMPQAYLDLPNGRVLYMMKSFMLKQVDIVRRDSYNEIKKGNVAKGLYNLARYGLVLGIAGATTDEIKNWMLGRKVDFKLSDVPANMLKTFGWSEYIAAKVRAGKSVEAAQDAMLPPSKIWDDIVRRDPKAVQYLGTPGKLLYYRGMGGAEKADKAQAKAERARNKKTSGKDYGL